LIESLTPNPSPGGEGDYRHSHQPEETKKGVTWKISKGRQYLRLIFRYLIIFSPPFEGGVAAVK
jgi:hypothetical protein